MLWKLLPGLLPEPGRVGNADDTFHPRSAVLRRQMLLHLQPWNQIADDDLLHAQKPSRRNAPALQDQSLMGTILSILNN